MANSNVNIASKLYAYIKHGVDIDQNIKQIYYNSMIFIGDEQQIYVPVMDTYVGIGTTAYNNTLDRITALEDRIQEVATALSQDLVSKLYVNYSWRDLDTTYNSYIRSADVENSPFTVNGEKAWQLNNEVTIKGLNDYDPETGFARKIDNPYVIQDAFGYQYHLDRVDNAATHVSGGRFDASDLYSDNAIPTSGITVTAYYGALEPVWNPISQQTVLKRIGNYISIDDSLTWSYMTNAYAYTLNYSTNYVNSEVERVYHNLLGDSEEAYVMISFGSAVQDIAYQYNKLTETEQNNYNIANPGFVTVCGAYVETPAGNSGIYIDDEHHEFGFTEEWDAYGGYAHVYKIKDQQYYYFAYDESAGVDYASEHDHTAFYVPITAEELGKILDVWDNGDTTELPTQDCHFGEQGIPVENEDPRTSTYEYDAHRVYIPASEVDYLPGNITFPQLYVKDLQYNSSYNMNIKDGIETLKEVAYLLDLLTDGRLGQTTYLSYSQFQAINYNADGETDAEKYAYVPWSWTAEYHEIDDTTTVSYAINEIGGWSYTGTAWTYTDGNHNDTIYNVVSPIGKQPKPGDIYTYYVITEDPENLGIQIAYSIAGNKTEIDDLHKHAYLLEKGETTLRSIQSTNTNFVNIDLIGGTTHWTDTDSDQGESNFGTEGEGEYHPNQAISGKNNNVNSYLVGDVNIKVSLATATTYTTTYTYGVEPGNAGVSYTYLDPYSIYWFGAYTAADMENLPASYTNSTYFTARFYSVPMSETETPYKLWDAAHTEVDDPAQSDYAVFSEITEELYLNATKGGRYQASGTQYYWKPNAANASNDNNQNLKFKSFTVKDYLALSGSSVLVKDGKVTPTGFVDLLTNDQHAVYLRNANGNYYQYTSGNDNNGSSQQTFREAFDSSDNLSTFNQGKPASEQIPGSLTEDSIIYIIDSSKIPAVEVHALIGTKNNEIDNTLATTEWVDVYLTAKVDEIAAALEDILEQAKQYTREKIGELDLDYKYSDFDTEYWPHYLSTITNPSTHEAISGDRTITVTQLVSGVETEVSYTYTYSDIIKVGSNEYNTIYNIEKELYEDRVNANHDYSVYTYYVDENDKGNYKLTYQLLSQYAYNTIEENGIVKPETRELPSDTLVTKYRVWGDEQNGSVKFAGQENEDRLSHVYADVVLAGASGEDTIHPADENDTTELYGEQESLFMKLFKWFNDQTEGASTDKFDDDVFENQLFVADGVTYKLVTLDDVKDIIRASLGEGHESDPITYEQYTDYLFNTNKSDFFYLSNPEQNIYSSFSNYVTYLTTDNENGVLVHGSLVGKYVYDGNNVLGTFDYANSNDKYWQQLYIQVPNYVEINLQKAKDDYAGTTTSNARDSLRIEIEDGVYYKLEAIDKGTQGTKIKVTKVDNNDQEISGFTQTTLKYITTFATPKKQYLTVENKHFSYVDNGQGENKFEITAHITNIEDATKDNTGFADAFDVQTYVKNFFSWVDVSASITDEILNSSDLYYRMITLDEYRKFSSDELNDPSTYLYIRKKTGNEVMYGDGTTAGQKVSYVAAWYWRDDSTFAGLSDGTDLGTLDGTETDVNFKDGLYYEATGDTPGWKSLTSNLYGAHIMNDGKWFFEGFYASGNKAKYEPANSNYYVRKEQPKINPLNLQTTKYGIEEAPAAAPEEPVEP